jgi:2',3'-cyclic-nucleotide 2'-phosphodiesterase (5'-nucleotidase family)
MPFDNRFAIVTVKGRHIRRLVANTIQRSSGIFSFGGLSAKARCKGGTLDVQITLSNGKPLADDADYKLVTSDFLASGGDGVIGRLKLPEGAITVTEQIIRDAIADVLRKKKGRVDPLQLYNPAKRRLDYEGKRPVSCQAGNAKKTPEEPD